MNAGRSEQTLARDDPSSAGRLVDAERLYRLVCDADPKNARAFHLLGVVAHQLDARMQRRWSAGGMLDPDSPGTTTEVISRAAAYLQMHCVFERAVALNQDIASAQQSWPGLRSLAALDEALTQFKLIVKARRCSVRISIWPRCSNWPAKSTR